VQTLYLIRHTTPAVEPGICYGQLDVGVTPGFEGEARQVAAWLPRPDLIVASPLKRARELGEYLARACNCELEFDARLMEKHFGRWEGQAWASIERSELDAWAADVPGYAPPGGESATQLMRRAQALLHDLGRMPQETIALTTHGGVIRAVLAHIAGMPLADILHWEVGYGAVIGVKYRRN